MQSLKVDDLPNIAARRRTDRILRIILIVALMILASLILSFLFVYRQNKEVSKQLQDIQQAVSPGRIDSLHQYPKIK